VGIANSAHCPGTTHYVWRGYGSVTGGTRVPVHYMTNMILYAREFNVDDVIAPGVNLGLPLFDSFVPDVGIGEDTGHAHVGVRVAHMVQICPASEMPLPTCEYMRARKDTSCVNKLRLQHMVAYSQTQCERNVKYCYLGRKKCEKRWLDGIKGRACFASSKHHLYITATSSLLFYTSLGVYPTDISIFTMADCLCSLLLCCSILLTLLCITTSISNPSESPHYSTNSAS
jgi:hypothetical protein